MNARKRARRLPKFLLILGLLAVIAIILVIVLITKFLAGAWIAILAMCVLFVIMKLIHHHYASVQRELDRAEEDDEAVLLALALAVRGVRLGSSCIDLAVVVEARNTSVEAVVERHARTTWEVAFAGFAPGFTHLAGARSRARSGR